MNSEPTEFPEPENEAQAAYYRAMRDWQISDDAPIVTKAEVEKLVYALLCPEGPSSKELGQIALALQFLDAERNHAGKILRGGGYPWPTGPKDAVV